MKPLLPKFQGLLGSVEIAQYVVMLSRPQRGSGSEPTTRSGKHPETYPGSKTVNRRWLVLALGLSAFGAWYHNIQEGFATLAPETLAALAPATGLAVWWSSRPGRTVWWATLIWVGPLNLLVGAVLSVLPLAVWPFLPQQTSSHYAAHLVYLLAQLPALYGLWLTRPRRTPT